jgi:type I restriction enzyme S subunit
MNGYLDKSGWSSFKFGDLALNITETSKDPIGEGLARYVGLEHLTPQSFRIASWGSTSDGTTFTKVFRKGDVLFGRRRSYQKKAAVADFDGVCSGDILVFRAKDTLDHRLLPYLVQNEYFFEYAVMTSAGSLSPRTKFKDLEKLTFVLPVIQEQGYLLDLLSSVESDINAKRSLRESLLRYKNALFYSLLSINDGASIKLNELFTINPPKQKVDPETKVSFITMDYVTEEGAVRQMDTRLYSEVSKGFTSFKDNDVIFAKITPCMENGKGACLTGLVNGIGFGSTEFHVLRPKRIEDSKFIHYITQNAVFRSAAERHMTGSAGQKRVQRDYFDRIRIKSLSPSERDELAEIAAQIDETIAGVDDNISQSLSLMHALQMEIT